MPALADEVLGLSIARAGGEETPVQALRRLFSPHDIVGIKVNCLAGRGLSPHPYLVDRLVGWLEEAGLPGRNILVWDRYDRELRAAGFTLSRRGANARCFGTESDYDWTPREWGSGGSCFARVLTDQITALINFGVLKDHDLAGVSAGLKNWYGVIHNPNKFHDDGCYPFVAHLAGHELIRKKHRLTILDASSAQYHGGPARAAQWTWPFEAVLASCDPLALDAVALSLIEAKRAEHKLPTLKAEKRYPRWIAEAARLGLGEAELARIERHSL